MKRFVFIFMTTLSMLFSSCKSDVEKAEDVIRDYMFETLYDYESYQPINTEKDGIYFKHKFRCKTAGGLSQIHTWKFFLSLGDGRVIDYRDDDGKLQLP